MADTEFSSGADEQPQLQRRETSGALDWMFSMIGRLWAKEKYESDKKALEKQLTIDRVSHDIRNGDEVVVNETFLSDNIRGRSKLKKGSRFRVAHIHPAGDMFLETIPQGDENKNQNENEEIHFDQQAIWITPQNFNKLDLPVGKEDLLLTMENCRVGFTYSVTELTTGISLEGVTEDKPQEVVFPPFTELEVLQKNEEGNIIVQYSLDEFDEPSFDRNARFKIESENFKFLKRTERSRLKWVREVREEQLKLMEKEREQVAILVAEQIKSSLNTVEVQEPDEAVEEVDPDFDQHKPQFPHLEGINFAKFLQSSCHLLDISPAVVPDEPELNQFKVLIKSKPIGIDFSFDTPYPCVETVNDAYLRDSVSPGMFLKAVGVTTIKARTAPQIILDLLKKTVPPVHFVFEEDCHEIESEDECELYEKGDKLRALETFDGDSIDEQTIYVGDILRVLAIDDGLKVQRVDDPWPRSEWVFEENYDKIQKIADEERIKTLVDDYLVQMDINYNAQNFEELFEKTSRVRLLKWAKGLNLTPDKRGAILHFVKAGDPEQYDEVAVMEESDIDQMIDTFENERLKTWQLELEMISDLWRFPPPRTKYFDRNEINVIICGESGSGKSTLFNFLRMDHESNISDDESESDEEEEKECSSKPDDSDDEESSSEEDELGKVGITETTKEMRKVEIRKGPLKICLWDSPGWGTVAFKSEEHVRNLGLAHFNVVIICSHSRVKQEEVDLSLELYKRKREFMSIRTQLDLELIKHQGFGKLKKKRKSKRKSKKSKKSPVDIIRDDFQSKLKEKGVIGHEVYLIGMDSEGNGMGFDYEKLCASLWHHVERDLYRTVGKATVKGGWSFHKGALSDVRDDAFSLLPVPPKFDLAIYDAREKLAKLKTVNNTGWFILSRLYKFSGLENDDERFLTINVTEYVDDIISHFGDPFLRLQPGCLGSHSLMYTILEFAMGNIFLLNATPGDGLRIVPARLSTVHEHKQVLVSAKNHCSAGCVAAFWSPKTVEVLTYYNEGKCSIDTVLYYREGVCTNSEIDSIKAGRSAVKKIKRIPFFQGEFFIEYFSVQNPERKQTEDVLLSGAFACARHRINLDERGHLDKYTIRYPHHTWTEMFSQFMNEKKTGFASFGPNTISYPPDLQSLEALSMQTTSHEDSLSRITDEMSYDCFTRFDDVMISPDPYAHHFEELEPVRLLRFVNGKPINKPLLQKSGTSSNVLLKRAFKLFSFAQNAHNTDNDIDSATEPRRESTRPGDQRSSIFRSGPSSETEGKISEHNAA